MTKLTYYTPCSPLERLLAPAVAVAASHVPPRGLRPVVKPCVRLCRHSRRPALRHSAWRAIDLVVGDGMAIRVRRQRAGRV